MMKLKTSHIARLLCTAAITTAMVACFDKGGDAGGDAPEGSAQSACAKATAHLASFTAGPGASGMEAMATKAATKAAQSKCDKEGLSDEQLACIMKVKTFRDYFTLGKCPAIEKKMPSWLKLSNPEPPATEVTVPEPYSLSLPGVIPDDLYNQVRTRPALKKGLDGGVIPALTSDASPAERVKALHEARAAALTADKETQPQGPPKIPTAEDLAAGPIGPRPGDPMHRAFDRVCTDVLRTWFRSYAAWLSSRSEVSIEQRITELEALEGAAPDAIPWSPGDGESARIDVSLARAVMLEKQP